MEVKDREDLLASIIPRFVFVVLVFLAIISILNSNNLKISFTVGGSGMLQAFLTSIIGAVSVLLGVFITQHYNAKKTKSEERRWYAGYFLKDKIEALQDLYVSMNECHFTLSEYLNNPPSSREEYREKVVPTVLAFSRASTKATIYLDSITAEVLRPIRSQIGMALTYISNRLNAQLEGQNDFSRTTTFTWTEFGASYDNAVARLSEVLNPNILRQFDRLE